MHKTLLLFILAYANPVVGADQVHVASASNFRQTAIQLNKLFEKTTKNKTILSSASTGALFSQIVNGAPFDVFLAADSNSPEKLEQQRRALPGSRFCYALGQLVLVGGSGSLKDLENPNLSLAIANPKTAPYGKAAQEVLKLPQFQAGGERKIVKGSNVLQAYQYWFTSSVDIALVAKSSTKNGGVVIPHDYYRPIVQEAVLLSKADGNSAARRYMKFLKSPDARQVIAAAGYENCQ